jgi:hypothetical protein
MGRLGGVVRGLLLVETGLRSLFMALLLFGVIIYGVVSGNLSMDLTRLLDARLLIIVVPGFVAFVGVWLRRRWGPVFAVASSLLDLLWWVWLASWAVRQYGGIVAYVRVRLLHPLLRLDDTACRQGV